MCPLKGPVVSITFDSGSFNTFCTHVHRRNGAMKPCVQRLFKVWPQVRSYRPALGLPFGLSLTMVYPLVTVHFIWCVQPSLSENCAIFRYQYCASLKESCKPHVYFLSWLLLITASIFLMAQWPPQDFKPVMASAFGFFFFPDCLISFLEKI